ncbi:MAG: SURF1 family protein [Proteobacteria bacterium]|nr:SURF1 family protein [Pseudomonadota bacterium]
MYFRPLPGVTIAVTILFAILIGLGVWQIQRLHWKEGLLAAIDHSLHAAPLRIDGKDAPLEGPAVPYTRVTGRGTFDYAKEVYLFASDRQGDPGYHVIVPFKLVNGQIYLVDRGYVPKEKLDPSTRRQGQAAGPQTVTGLTRVDDGPGPFTPPTDFARRIWYSRDALSIAKADGIRLAYPGMIEADATPNPGGWPKGGQTIIDIPNNHLQYAITWFLMALALLGVYGAYHVSRGRLGLRRRD